MPVVAERVRNRLDALGRLRVVTGYAADAGRKVDGDGSLPFSHAARVDRPATHRQPDQVFPASRPRSRLLNMNSAGFDDASDLPEAVLVLLGHHEHGDAPGEQRYDRRRDEDCEKGATGVHKKNRYSFRQIRAAAAIRSCDAPSRSLSLPRRRQLAAGVAGRLFVFPLVGGNHFQRMVPLRLRGVGFALLLQGQGQVGGVDRVVAPLDD